MVLWLFYLIFVVSLKPKDMKSDYKKFKEGVKVSVAEHYLNDEVTENLLGKTAKATVKSEPSDVEELVAIVYESGVVDYVPQDILEIIPVYYQPEFVDGKPPFYQGTELYSFEVYHSKSEAQKDFPKHKIIEYSGDDIEEPTFVDEDED